jgi:uncharacterized protein
VSGNKIRLFSPPEEAVSLYVGPVMHARLKPVHHRFSYRVFSILIDLDALKRIHKKSLVFSINQFNLFSFYERDHGRRDGTSLSQYALDLFHTAGIELEGGRILLLSYPRFLGYVFDPLTIYFGYSSNGELKGVLYEVRNTFGEAHTYVEPVEPNMLTEAGLRQVRMKRFYVSPFNPLDMTYFFRLRPPNDQLAVRILVKDAEGPVLAASFFGKKRAFSSANLIYLGLTIPFLTLKIIIGIHVEAFWLWVKGMRLVPRPAPPPPISFPPSSETQSGSL